MSRKTKRSAGLVLAVCAGLWFLALGLGIFGEATALAPQLSNEQLLEQVSRERAIPLQDLAVADRVTQTYPLTGVRVDVAKILNKATGEARLVARDARGVPIDPAAAEAAERAVRFARYGKIDPRLHARLERLGASETLPVSIWLNVPEPPRRRSAAVGVAAEAAQAAVASHLEGVSRFMAPARQGVISALTNMGVQPRVPRYAPAVFASLNRVQIEQISRHLDVDVVYGPERYGRVNDDAATTHRAHRVWTLGNRGAGPASRPVVHEDDGIADFNPFLNNSTHTVVFYCSNPSPNCFVGKNIEDHASEVAGVIASTHPVYTGIAPSASLLLSANFQSFQDPGFDFRSVDAFEWARGNGGDPTNLSWGTFCGGFETFWSRYADWAVRNLFATLVIAAGNHPTPCGVAVEDEKVSAPGLAWSVITVGSHLDANTGFWSNDFVSGFSDWRDPDFSPGTEKPEVIAVGQDVITTDDQGGDHITAFGVNGTSFAAPMVAGQVTQMLARQPGQNQWPETNKAAVLASAYHDIEATFTPGDGRDGVGSPVMNNSDDTYRFGRFINDACGGLCDAANFPRQYLDVISANAGNVVRVAIAWDANPSCNDTNSDGNVDTCGSNALGADIDLRVRHPNNTTIVCQSISLANAWEMCQFTAPVTGTYDILLSLFSSQPGWPGTFLGTAWSIRALPNFCSGAIAAPGPSNSFTLNTNIGSTFFDSYAGWAFGQAGRERVLKFTLGTTKDIRVTDTNPVLDLHVLQFPNCAADPIVPTVVANGADSIFINNAPAGTYYVVLDARNDQSGTSTVTVTRSGP